MFSRLSNSWELVKASWAVLRADKELVIFPIISGIGLLIVTITFAVPMFLTGAFEGMLGESTDLARIVGYILVFLFYLAQYFVIIFANSALVGAAMIRLDGGDPTVSDGLRIALNNIGSIFGYAIISATVGLILRWISERGGLGRLVASLFGLAWNLATYLAVPVLVVEGVGPLQAVKRSGRLLKNTWGEQIVGNISIGLVFGLAMVITFIIGTVTIVAVAAGTENTVLIVLLVALLVLIVAFLGVISSTLSGIYSAAVYRFAINGDTGVFFRKELVENAFRPK